MPMCDILFLTLLLVFLTTEETAATPLDMVAELDTEDRHDISPTSQVKLGVTSVTVEFNFSDPNDPKR